VDEMDKMEKLKKEYVDYIQKLRNEWEEKANYAKENGDEDNYVKGQIKVQMTQVFEKVFLAKYKKIENE